jgi:hypothetical protein
VVYRHFSAVIRRGSGALFPPMATGGAARPLEYDDQSARGLRGRGRSLGVDEARRRRSWRGRRRRGPDPRLSLHDIVGVARDLTAARLIDGGLTGAFAAASRPGSAASSSAAWAGAQAPMPSSGLRTRAPQPARPPTQGPASETHNTIGRWDVRANPAFGRPPSRLRVSITGWRLTQLN